MAYAHIFTLPPTQLLILSVIQTATVYCFILIGLRIVGRRVFTQREPQDLVIIVLVAEACNLGLAPVEAGFWGSICSVTTLIILGHFTKRIPFIRHLLYSPPIVLYRAGKLHHGLMRKHMVDVEDLNEIAREKGSSSYKDFDSMTIEGDGRISAVKIKKMES